MTPEQIYSRLRELAPNVAFLASRTEDPDDEWDGDGPDPRENGYRSYKVDVVAATIINGEAFEESAFLDSCFMLEDEKIGDMCGYLPQKLASANENLLSLLHDRCIRREGPDLTITESARSVIKQLRAVEAFLEQEMRDRYAAQQRERTQEKTA